MSSSAVFVDTGGWYALQVVSDRWHPVAAAAFKDLTLRRARITTSNLVIGETYTLLRMTHNHDTAWRFVETLSRSALLVVLRVDDAIEKQAWALLKKFDDQAFSFVDATSFALMRARKVRHAIAFDAHFAAAGFTRVGLDGLLP